MISYCSLAEARTELKANTAADNDQLYNYTRMVSRRIDQLLSGRSTRPYFAPYSEARYILLNGGVIDSYHNTLLLDFPLLAFTALTADGTDILSVSEGFPQGRTPYNLLRITASGNSWLSYLCNSSGNPGYAVITGLWGYHSDYANAWLSVDTLDAVMTAGATSFSVVNIDGDDAYGIADRISRGMLVKIDSEYMLVTDTDAATNDATVRRAIYGTTAAQHEVGAVVYRWEVEEPIRRIVSRQAAMMYARQGAFQVETLDGVGSISYPQDLLKELVMTLQEYQYG